MKRGKLVSRAIIDPLAITVARCLRHWHMKVVKGLGNKKYLITYSKILQIASTADQLASKKNLETPQLVDKNSSSHPWIWPTKRSKNNFFAAHAMVIVSMMTYKMRGVWGWTYPSWMKTKMDEKRGLPWLKIAFLYIYKNNNN